MINNQSIKFSDIRKKSDLFFQELELSSEPITILKRSKPVAVIMTPKLYNQLQKAPQANWRNARANMAFLTKGFVKGEGGTFDAVDLIRKDRGYES